MGSSFSTFFAGTLASCQTDLRGTRSARRMSSTMLSAGVLLLALPIGMALAAGPTVGNPAIKRKAVDMYSDFTVVDTNHPVSAAGSLSMFQYYAANKNPFELVLVDKNNVVQWMSPTITPAAVGVQTYKPAAPVQVQAGWN